MCGEPIFCLRLGRQASLKNSQISMPSGDPQRPAARPFIVAALKRNQDAGLDFN
jgi:hypothetical protein